MRIRTLKELNNAQTERFRLNYYDNKLHFTNHETRSGFVLSPLDFTTTEILAIVNTLGFGAELVEEPKLTSREWHFLNYVQTGWIAMDSSEMPWYYTDRPVKRANAWASATGESTKLPGNMFEFMEWEDSEPWSVEDLLKLRAKPASEKQLDFCRRIAQKLNVDALAASATSDDASAYIKEHLDDFNRSSGSGRSRSSSYSSGGDSGSMAQHFAGSQWSEEDMGYAKFGDYDLFPGRSIR